MNNINYLIWPKSCIYPQICSRSSSAYQTLFWGNGIGHCTV